MIRPDEPPGAAPEIPLMSPAEREIWMNSKGAPAGMMMVHESEWSRVMNALRQGRLHLATSSAGRDLIERILGDYFATEPDLANAVGAAVHDARRFKSSNEMLRMRLPRATAKIEVVLRVIHAVIDPTAFADLTNILIELNDLAEILKIAAELRRDRTIRA